MMVAERLRKYTLKYIISSIVSQVYCREIIHSTAQYCLSVESVSPHSFDFCYNLLLNINASIAK